MRILDATCGKRIMWLQKYHPDVVYLDIRPLVKPQIVADVCYLPFQDKVFDLVIFDPPHVNMGKNSKMGQRYGAFTMAYIRYAVAAGFVEISRVLKDDGAVLFKWNTHDIKTPQILELIPCQLIPLIAQGTTLPGRNTSETFWFTLIKSNKK